MYGSMEAEEDPGATAGMIGGGREAGARSLARILFRRVLLISTNGLMDRSVERSNFSCLRKRVMRIPKEVLRSHVIDDELENTNSNAFQKAIDQEGSRTPCMTIFS